MIPAALQSMHLPESFAGSRLVAQGGVAVLRGLLPESTLRALLEDAAGRESTARHSAFSGPNAEEWRGGSPARAMAGCGAGDAQFNLFASAEFAEVMSETCGVRLRCSGGGSYAWYTRPGDHLALHRDIVSCDVAVITCLHRSGPSGGADGSLCVYPSEMWKPMGQVLPEGRIAVPMEAGDTAVLAGGLVPHEVTKTAPGQRRIVSIGCFALA